MSVRDDLRAAGRALDRAFRLDEQLVMRTVLRTPTDQRERCGARTRSGAPCAAPVVWVPGEPAPRRRCRMHGGLSTGPRSADGLRRSLANLRGVAPETSRALRYATGAAEIGRDCPDCRRCLRRLCPACDRELARAKERNARSRLATALLVTTYGWPLGSDT